MASKMAAISWISYNLALVAQLLQEIQEMAAILGATWISGRAKVVI